MLLVVVAVFMIVEVIVDVLMVWHDSDGVLIPVEAVAKAMP